MTTRRLPLPITPAGRQHEDELREELARVRALYEKAAAERSQLRDELNKLRNDSFFAMTLRAIIENEGFHRIERVNGQYTIAIAHPDVPTVPYYAHGDTLRDAFISWSNRNDP